MQPRANVVAQLERYLACVTDVRECAMGVRVRDFVAGYADCFERASSIGHCTGSAWIVDRALTSTVLVHHRKLRRWLQPGGHADGNPDLCAVALREAYEETGLRDLVPALATIFDVDVHRIPARANEPEHEHFDVRYAFFANRSQRPRANAESHAVAWVPLATLAAEETDESVRRLVRKTASLARAARTV